MSDAHVLNPPQTSYLQLFLRFLRFGFMAWGGPAAQIAMIRQELVDEEHWISNERFNRVLAVYQVLPGPEATELCVYFGMLARGRVGGFLAGLGFVVPGFVLMLGLSWFYVQYGMTGGIFAAVFYGMQPAVVALIARAVHRIGSHALGNRWLLGIAVFACILQLLNINFIIILPCAGLAYILIRRGWYSPAIVIGLALIIGALLVAQRPREAINLVPEAAAGTASPLSLFGSGLSAGLLTFGGAYTVIPFLRHDAVEVNGWMTGVQFLDGIALSGILPAPLVIFGTFIGYVTSGIAGAVAMTAGIFGPAFAFTLVGHDALEKAIANTSLHNFLDGVTAGVVGLIAAVSIMLAITTLTDLPKLLIFAAALLVLFRWKSKMNVPVVVLCAGLVGLLLFQGV
jgi:chromate transporter